MDDELNDKINQVAQMLGKNEVPDNVKEIIASLANNSNSSCGPAENAESCNSTSQSSCNDDINQEEMAENIAMISMIKKVVESSGGANDHRVSLLAALKPFLNDSRQDKLKNCMKIFKLTQLTKVLKDTDII